MSNFNYSEPFRGNVSAGSETSDVIKLPRLINNFRLVNKSDSSSTVNVYLISDDYQICISPLNQSLGSGQMYLDNDAIIVTQVDRIMVETTGDIDFDFTISNINAGG